MTYTSSLTPGHLCNVKAIRHVLALMLRIKLLCNNNVLLAHPHILDITTFLKEQVASKMFSRGECIL